MSCQSPRVKEKVIIPELYFPDFPPLDLSQVRIDDDGKVAVPDEWIMELARYRIYIEGVEEDYNHQKEKLNGQ